MTIAENVFANTKKWESLSKNCLNTAKCFKKSPEKDLFIFSDKSVILIKYDVWYNLYDKEQWVRVRKAIKLYQ